MLQQVYILLCQCSVHIPIDMKSFQEKKYFRNMKFWKLKHIYHVIVNYSQNLNFGNRMELILIGNLKLCKIEWKGNKISTKQCT